jgi:hypothetical protein
LKKIEINETISAVDSQGITIFFGTFVAARPKNVAFSQMFVKKEPRGLPPTKSLAQGASRQHCRMRFFERNF